MADFDPHDLIAKAQQRKLRHGEALALSTHLTSLERSARSAREHNLSVCSQSQVEVSLNLDLSALLVTLPGVPPHTISIPLAQGGAFITDFLVKLLRTRRGKINTIATPGAPTQADLEALVKATAKKPRKLAVQVSLEDLDL